MSEQSFREIQLNGKQLVFLFMSVTVAAVVIFLLGVLVGRDIRSDRPAVAEPATSEVAPDPIAPAPARTAGTSTQLPAEAPPPSDELTFPEVLKNGSEHPDKLKASASEAPPSAKAAPKTTPPAPQAVKQPTAPPANPPTPVATSTAPEPSGPGFAVQVAAFKDRRDADTMVKRLSGKGYPAFIMAPVKGAPTAFYRVRVGKYKDQREAEAVSRKLEKEEQLKPWIAR